FEQYHHRIFHYLLRLTQDQAEAEDLTQETFIRVHNSLPKFRGEASLSTWIYRIATNVNLDHLRKNSNKKENVDHSMEDLTSERDWIADEETDSPEQATTQFEMSACVQSFVMDLPSDYRIVLIMHDMKGLKNQEIADILNCTLDTVKIRLHRARKMLRESLNKGCNFTRDESNVFVCEPTSVAQSIIKLDMADL
ncbi:RNA polymerase sigma factor, partial [Chloroflexota bacterium]